MKPIIYLKPKAKGIKLKAAFVICSTFAICTQAFAQAPNINYGTPPAFSLNQTITTLTPTNSGGQVSVSGQTITFAGGSLGYADGTGSSAQFNSPAGMVCDPAGNVYVT